MTHDARGFPRACEAGFTLVEMIVVMVILAVLMAIAIPTFLGAKTSAHYREAVVAASSYRQAIASYQLDHGNLTPDIASWGTGSGDPQWSEGPMNDLFTPPRPYMKVFPPDDVKNRRTTLNSSPTPTGSTLSYIGYVRLSPTQFQIVVFSRPNTTTAWTASSVKSCQMGNVSVPKPC